LSLLIVGQSPHYRVGDLVQAKFDPNPDPIRPVKDLIDPDDASIMHYDWLHDTAVPDVLAKLGPFVRR
jgi:hypothetical protein